MTDFHRRSIRLQGYDYTLAGAYFVTVCAQDRACLFGEIRDGVFRANDAGRMVQVVWDELHVFYPHVETDAFVVMPNHVHGIVVLTGPERNAPLSLPDVVHRFKTMTTKRYTDGVKSLGWPPYRGRVWQRNYYEHVVRDEDELNRVQEYILTNPMRWEFDEENPIPRPEP